MKSCVKEFCNFRTDMKLNEYKQLSDEKQYDILWDKGVLVDACIEGKVKKLLYAIDNFFVELWCDLLTNNVSWKLSFKQGRLLEKYLNRYPLEFIYNIEKE